MDFKELAGTLLKFAPMIATGLGTPISGMAIAALQGALGVKEVGSSQDKVQSIVEALSGATADQLLAIKVAEQAYAVDMAKLGFKNVADLEALAAGDRDSARKREIEVKDNTPKILAYAVTIGYFLILAALMTGNVPAGSTEILYIMLGTLGTAWIGIINYYYGSSSSSNEKTRLLAASTPAKT